MLGGAAGALARAGLAETLHWPWATLIANLAGTALLAWLVEKNVGRHLLGTGFCGALTTFSTFQLETFRFVRDGDVALAVLYPAVSIALGMLVAIGGVLLARWGRHW